MVVVVVLGTGSIGARHLSVLQGMDGVTPIAVPARPKRAKELAAAGFTTATDLADAVKQAATHCVIATDTGSHVAHCQTAMELGLEVLVEKPAAVDAPGAYQLQERAAKHGKSLYVGCVMRFTESLNTFKDMLPRAGRLHAVRIECQSYMPDWRPHRSYLESYAARPLEGGVLLDLIHEIDYSGWIFGWPEAVEARVRNMGSLGIAADEATEVSWEIDDILQVSVYLDYLSKPPRRVMRAYGDQGTIEWDGISRTVTLTSEDAPAEVVTSTQERNDTFQAQAKAFLQASQDPHDPRLATIHEGGMALSVCDAARLASANRREEQVKYL
jgi:predicted dehydrogenase